MIFVFATRYASIYHPDIVANVQEERVLKGLKIILVAAPVICLLLEFLYLSDIREMMTYKYFLTGMVPDEGNLGRIPFVMVIMNFSTALFLHVRIELDHINFGEDSCLVQSMKQCSTLRNESNQSRSLPFGLNTIRLILGTAAVLIVIVGYHVSVRGENLRYSSQSFSIFLFCICPWVFVLSHGNMKTIAFKLVFRK